MLFPTRTRATLSSPRCFIASAVAAPCGSSTERLGMTVTMAFTPQQFRVLPWRTSRLSFSAGDVESAGDGGNGKATERKNFSIPRVKSFRWINRDVQLREEHALDKSVSLVILQLVHNPSESIDHAGNSGVRRPDHRQFCFRAAKKCVHHMLL